MTCHPSPKLVTRRRTSAGTASCSSSLRTGASASSTWLRAQSDGSMSDALPVPGPTSCTGMRRSHGPPPVRPRTIIVPLPGFV